MSKVDLEARIPNNVDLKHNKKLCRALEHWQPAFLEWFHEMGPADFNQDLIYLRTAIGVGKGGWANFDYVKMPDYRWGIFLSDPSGQGKIHFGDHLGEDIWTEVPGEYRNPLKRLIVTQGDTEPASVEQQRQLGHTCPSLYDLRNLFQVNVEEGRHLWAMVYLLHTYFGKDGRNEGEELLVRRSGNQDNPRILEAFNKPIDDWLSFFCFTTFTDRDGKYQLCALAESAFDPLARTTQFMLTEEAHHMFVGETGVGRVIQRTAELMKEGKDPKKVGGIPFDIIQKYVNEWSSASYDLFGGEDSSNAANYFSQSLKGRYHERKAGYNDPKALKEIYSYDVVENGKISKKEIPLRRAMNALLLDAYWAECAQRVEKWNEILKKYEQSERIKLPSLKFNRHQGVYGGLHFDPDGKYLGEHPPSTEENPHLPSEKDRQYVKECMVKVTDIGKFANWIAPPPRGINSKPIDFEYVKFH